MLLGTGVCAGAGTRDLADGWLLGLGAVAHVLGTPPGSPTGTWLSAGQTRLFGLPELPVLALEAGWRQTGWPGPLSCVVTWQRLGDPLFLEDVGNVHVQFGRQPVLGLAVGRVQVTTEAREFDLVPTLSAWQTTFSVQWDWRPSRTTELRMLLWLSLAEPDEATLSRARRPLLKVEGWRGQVALAAAVDLKADQTPTFGLEVVLGSGRAAWGLRLEPESGVAGPVFHWCRGRLQLGTSHLAHPQLGVTHRFRIALGAWGAPRW
jgi:hypothetical protein